jgi:hypothetical protein
MAMRHLAVGEDQHRQVIGSVCLTEQASPASILSACLYSFYKEIKSTQELAQVVGSSPCSFAHVAILQSKFISIAAHQSFAVCLGIPAFAQNRQVPG